MASTDFKSRVRALTARRHIGDGVYAEYDGYQIWLTLLSGSAGGIALDRETMAALAAYSRQIEELHREQAEAV